MLKIASIGDVCVDVYPEQNKFFLGGTAFNRAVWLAQNGAAVSLVSAVGTDEWGQKYLESCKKLNINTDFLSVLPGKTSQVKITLDQNQSPQFSAWETGVLSNFRPAIWPQNQNALITTGLKPIKPLLTVPLAPFSAADFDGNTPYSFNNAAIGKLAKPFNLIITSRPLAISHPMILTTLGAYGSRLTMPGKTHYAPIKKTEIGDTTGAGDAYIAAFILNYLKFRKIPLAMKLATKAAAKTIASPRDSVV